jgi:NitT/TauT family transport system ATP-binding protein
MFEVAGVALTYPGEHGDVRALAGVDLALAAGTTLAVLGPTGCGKSSLLLLLDGLLMPTAGTVRFQGLPLERPHPRLALVLQDYGLFAWKTVRQNAELGLRLRGRRDPRAEVDAMLAELGIADKQDAYPRQLSGGQQQRVALARALLLAPDALLLDEPFAALDTLTRERLQDLVVQLWQARRFGLVLVTHDIPEAVRLGQRIAILSPAPGRIVEILDNPTALTSGQRGEPAFDAMVRTVRGRLAPITASAEVGP